jgi:hypothetical protein
VVTELITVTASHNVIQTMTRGDFSDIKGGSKKPAELSALIT